MVDPLRMYASRLIECHVLSSATRDPLAKAAYAAMAGEFVSKIIGNADAIHGAMYADLNTSERTGNVARSEDPNQPPAAVARKRLMVVDDQIEITRIIRAIAEARGYDVRVVINPTEAFTQFLEFAPHVLITDIVMPDLDGIELLQMIGRSGRTPRILVMSGYGDLYLHLADTLATGSGMPFITTMAKPIAHAALIRFLTPEDSRGNA